MVKIKGGDELYLDVYYVKEYQLKEVVGKDGIVNKYYSVDAKLLLNPDKKYLNRENVQVVSHKVIKVQIMEVNRVGGKLVEPHYLIGLRFVEGNKATPVFHIMVKNDEEFKQKLAQELRYYFKTASLIT